MSERNFTKFFTRFFSRLISVCVIVIWSNQLLAHEFWLEPINFEVKPNEKIRAHEKVGQDFKGNKYSYLSSSYVSLDITQDGETHAIKSRLGDLPAVSVGVEKSGLVILSAVTTPSTVTYETWEKFENFLNNKGLQWVVDVHKNRQLPEKNFRESYRRYGKSLVKVGHGKGNDQKLGLLFEWVLQTNPYTSDTDNIKAQLLWQGKPLVGADVSIFNRLGDELIKTHLVTDKEGRIDVPRAKGGKFLLNAVKMLKASDAIEKDTGAVWDSRWASITYEIKSVSSP